MGYSPRDYAEMHYYYGVARGNARLASRLYEEHVRRRGGPQPERYPDHRLFLRTHNAYMEGRIPGKSGRLSEFPTDERVDAVLNEVQGDSSTSVRMVSRRTGIPKSSVHRILQVESYHPYHIQKVQELKPEDYPKRVLFCQEMLQKNREDDNFFNNILWTDESHFKRTGIFNMHNYHSWSIDNPHMVRSSNFQRQFSVNLWCGILNGQLIGPFELPDRLDGNTYLNFLRNDLPTLLEDVNLRTRKFMVFQNDGAPCHYSQIVRDFLNEQYPQKWIGRGGPISWPPRSPDLNPVDFFVWGYYKELVYSKESFDIDELRRKLSQAENQIKRNMAAFRNIKRNFLNRCRLCIQTQGRHCEQLL